MGARMLLVLNSESSPFLILLQPPGGELQLGGSRKHCSGSGGTWPDGIGRTASALETGYTHSGGWVPHFPAPAPAPPLGRPQGGWVLCRKGR